MSHLPAFLSPLLDLVLLFLPPSPPHNSVHVMFMCSALLSFTVLDCPHLPVQFASTCLAPLCACRFSGTRSPDTLVATSDPDPFFTSKLSSISFPPTTSKPLSPSAVFRLTLLSGAVSGLTVDAVSSPSIRSRPVCNSSRRQARENPPPLPSLVFTLA